MKAIRALALAEGMVIVFESGNRMTVEKVTHSARVAVVEGKTRSVQGHVLPPTGPTTFSNTEIVPVETDGPTNVDALKEALAAIPVATALEGIAAWAKGESAVDVHRRSFEFTWYLKQLAEDASLAGHMVPDSI